MLGREEDEGGGDEGPGPHIRHNQRRLQVGTAAVVASSLSCGDVSRALDPAAGKPGRALQDMLGPAHRSTRDGRREGADDGSTPPLPEGGGGTMGPSASRGGAGGSSSARKYSIPGEFG